MDVTLTVDILMERADGQEITDADILALRREVQRVISRVWANGEMSLDEYILDDPMVFCEVD